MAPETSPNSKAPTDMPNSYWRATAQESPLTPAFSPFTQMQPQNWSNAHTEASPRNELSWSVPQRSTSYSNLEGLSAQHNHHHYTPYSQTVSSGDSYSTKPRVLHSMYPPTISTAGASVAPPESLTTSNDASQPPNSAGVLPSFPSWPSNPPPHTYQRSAPPTGDQYGSWNNSQGGHLPLPVEIAHSGAPAYNYSEGPGMYYPATHR